METVVWNPLKCRLQTIYSEDLTDKNTTWFEDWKTEIDLYLIADINGGILIKNCSYDYPYWIEGESRKSVDYNQQNAKKLMAEFVHECL